MIKINRIERPQTVIKVLVKPISVELKTKISSAVQSFVNRVKDKHLN